MLRQWGVKQDGASVPLAPIASVGVDWRAIGLRSVRAGAFRLSRWYGRALVALNLTAIVSKPPWSRSSILNRAEKARDLSQFAPARTNIRFMFHAMVTRAPASLRAGLHSPRTLFEPRSMNWRNPITDLMIPNTGSGVCLRWA